MKLTKPYGLVPGHVYVLDKLNSDRFTIPASYGTIPEGMEILRNQARSGKKLADNVYLRIFPVAVQRRGYHATLLSKTKAISMIAKVLNDEELKQIAAVTETKIKAKQVSKDGTTKYGLVDTEGNIVLEAKYEAAFPVGEELVGIMQTKNGNKKYGIINRDGKEIVAKENSVSALRKTKPQEAYFNCHTDITIPYDELKLIEIIKEDDTRESIIADGRFVLNGTEELNEPFMEK